MRSTFATIRNFKPFVTSLAFARCRALRLVFATTVLLGPIYFPITVYEWWGSTRQAIKKARELEKIRRSYVEPCFDPLHSANMNPDLLAYINQQSQVLDELGYQCLGDCWLKPQAPFKSIARFYLSSDGSRLIEIGRTMETNYCDLVTFFENGHVANTVNCVPTKIFGQMKSHGFHIYAESDLELGELLQAHDRLRQEIQSNQTASVRTITADRWKDYSLYHYRFFAQISVSLGDKDEGPKECAFPLA